MKGCIRIAAALAAVLGVGCAPQGAITKADAGPPLMRIGLLADTQLTSPKATSNYLFRSQIADLAVNVAVRTSAQEVLAGEHLGCLAEDLLATQPDVLLYLGDGANSGCDDEIEPFFAQLERIRTQAGKPVFFVVGNHDYLATGNQAAASMRTKACAGGGYVTKAELIARTAAFNRASWQRFASRDARFVRYADSLDHVNATDGAGCKAGEALQQEQACYYAAVIEWNAGGHPTQLVLADTSDYTDVVRQPRIDGVDIAEFAGARGSMGWEAGGQNAWIEKALGPSPARTRVIASHYPTADLSWTRYYSGRPGDLMLSDGHNLWLSGHTHDPDPDSYVMPGSFEDTGPGEEVMYDEINVGSTTDHRAHAALVALHPGRATKQPVLAMDAEAASACEARIDGVQLGSGYASPYHRNGSTRHRLGLTKHYRRTGYDAAIARKNIETFLAEPGQAADREQWVRCLMHAGAKAEASKWPGWML
ncbi:metallophosphoesterase family protein [Cognatilysobacter tabacisoli]|uniref:metallophosphoesterase family protein n=1 Tax=Cognatilysobacter tabacisoli TaxID=2315424 RepID=UPI000E6B2D47|nr:metallophosphoesterase [Lysobacter tabacisoli]